VDSETFRNIATELYGPAWVRVLADATNLHTRSIREMGEGKRFIPIRLAELLLALQSFSHGAKRNE
jgi:hypothetical protein